MVLALKITVNRADVMRINSKLGNVNKAVEMSHLEMAREVRSSLRRELMSNKKKAPRSQWAAKIKARKISKSASAIFMPQQLIWLDSARPHFVSLKRGRNISLWARKYFDGSYRKTGLSRIYKTKRGRVFGSIYVTPSPFINVAVMKVQDKYVSIINKNIKKAFRGAI